MVRGRVWRWALCVAILPCVAGVTVWASVADDKAGWTVMSAAVAALVGGFAPTLFDALRPGRSPDTVLQETASGLAATVLARVRASPLRARLHRPMPMRVRFTSATGVGASRQAVTGVAGVGWSEAPLAGHVGEVASRLRELPWRQLVVTGEPGAGKSVLALMLVDQLLRDRPDGEPVPVLIGVSSWDPAEESVAQFVGRRLAEDHGLADPTARRLVTEPRVEEGRPAGWWILPVLDGVDEIDPSSHGAAVAAVEAFAGGDRPVVLTCRTREFARAESAAGVLARAAVIRLDTLRVDDVIEFLSDPSPQRQTLWDPVFARLREQPTGVLAQALSSPLMAGLAKDTFATDDPRVLATLGSRSEISARLIDGYVAAAYRQGAHPADAPRPYDARDAARWLASLAYLGHLSATRDLSWWRMPWIRLAVSPRRMAWSLGVGVGAAAALLAQLVTGWSVASAVVWGVLVGACSSGVFGTLFAHDLQPAVDRVPEMWRYSARYTRILAAVRWTTRAAYGVVAGLAAGPLVGSEPVGAVAGLACGVAVPALPSLRSVHVFRGPTGTLRANHVLAVAASAKHAAVAAVVFAVAGGLLGGDVWSWALAGGATFAVAGLSGGEAGWIRFRLCQVVFAVRGARLPLRLIRFLDDATHPDRATMRVNGNAWQFRHASIQDHLLRHGELDVLRRRSSRWDGRSEFARVLRERGDVDELRRRAGDDWDARRELARLLRHRGDVDELRARADDPYASVELARLLCARGEVDEALAILRPYSDAGFWESSDELARLLRQRGDADELRRYADAGDWSARRELARLLHAQGNAEELRVRADAGDGYAADELVGLLEERGDRQELIARLRRRVDAGDVTVAGRVAQLLDEQGDADEAMAVLRRFAGNGDPLAGAQLVRMLHDRGRVDELRQRADNGDRDAELTLTRLLAERGDVDELRRRVDAGSGYAAVALAQNLRERSEPGEAIAVLRRVAGRGDPFVVQTLADVLREVGDVRGAVALLRRNASRGGRYAAGPLARFLREEGDLDGAAAVLRRSVDRGHADDALLLVELLRERGDVDGAIAVLRRAVAQGDTFSALGLAELLREQGNLDEALAVLRPFAGTTMFDEEVAEVLRQQGNVDEAIVVLRRSFDRFSSSTGVALARLLREQGNLDESTAVLRRCAAAGYYPADEELTRLRESGHGPE